VPVFDWIKYILTRAAFRYMFPEEMSDDNNVEYEGPDGKIKTDTIGALYVESFDEAIQRYYDRSNLCYTVQDWNFTAKDRRINKNC
jgi:hypothetical protein